MSKLLEFFTNFDCVSPGVAIVQRARGKQLFICEIPSGRSANDVLRVLKRAGCKPALATARRMGNDLYVNVRNEEEAKTVMERML